MGPWAAEQRRHLVSLSSLRKLDAVPWLEGMTHKDGTAGRALLPALGGTVLRVYPYFFFRKVFQKLHLCISEADIQKVVSNKPGVIESILCSLKEKMEAGTAHGGPAGAAVSVRTSAQPASGLCLLSFVHSQTICLCENKAEKRMSLWSRMKRSPTQ